MTEMKNLDCASTFKFLKMLFYHTNCSNFIITTQIEDQVIITLDHIEDHLIWKNTTSGSSLLKMLIYFSHQLIIKSSGLKLFGIQVYLPQNPSCMVLRFIHKLPTYENLAVRGCHMPLMCNLCNKKSETSELFPHCPFPIALRNWLHYISEHNININSILPIFDGYPHYQHNTIWFIINNYRFNNIGETLSITIAMTTANVSLGETL